MTGVVLRSRYLLLTALAFVCCVPIYAVWAGVPGDFFVVDFGGRALVGMMPTYHAGVLHLYATHGVIQVGPPPLLLLGLVNLIDPRYAQPVWGWLIGISCLIAVRLGEVTAVRIGCSRRRAALGSLLLGPVVIAVWASLEQYYHLEDALTVLAVVGAMWVIAARRPWWVAALLVGFAVTCKPWAIMLLPVLFALPPRVRVKAAGVAVASAAVWWLPFIVADPHTVTSLSGLGNVVLPMTGLHGLGWPGATPPLAGRYLEFLLGFGLCALTVSRGRWVMAPLAAFAGRALLDPRWFAYYGAGPVLAAFIVDLTGRRRFPLWTVSTAVLLVVVPQLQMNRLGGVVQVVWALAVIAVGVVSAPARDDADADHVRSRADADLGAVQVGV